MIDNHPLIGRDGQNKGLPKRSATKLLFAELPTEIQKRILKLQQERGEYFSYPSASGFVKWLLLPPAIVWLPVLFYAANGIRWSNEVFWTLSAITAAAFTLSLYGAYTILRPKLSRLRPFVHITPTHFIKTTFDEVDLRDLSQIQSVFCGDNHEDNRYRNTMVEFSFEDGAEERVLSYGHAAAAANLVQKVETWRVLYKQAQESGDAAYLAAHNVFHGLSSRKPNESKQVSLMARKAWVPLLLLVAVGVPLLTAGTMWAANRTNDFLGDRAAWSDAHKANSAVAFRQYLRTRPNRRFANQARQHSDEQYDLAAKHYSEKHQQNSDKQAFNFILQMLAYARLSKNSHVHVVFERHDEIPPDFAERKKQETGFKNILPVGDSFSDEKMKERESSILIVIRQAFRRGIPENVLEIVGAENATGDSVILISYYIKPAKKLADLVEEESVNPLERTYYPEIAIAWQCDISVPNTSEHYKFSVESEPSDFKYRRDLSGEARKADIYDHMIGTEFENFGLELAKRLGLSVGDEKQAQINDNKVTVSERSGHEVASENCRSDNCNRRRFEQGLQRDGRGKNHQSGGLS
jgi:hypothetical protein